MSQSFREEVTAVLEFLLELIVLIINFWITSIWSLFQSCIARERSVEGDVVLITGSGHGIGRELALQYACLGATVVCWDINEQMNTQTVNTIKASGGKAFGYTVDVCNRETVLKTGKLVLDEIGAVTILVNNAGIMPQHGLFQHTEAEIKRVFDINVFAHFWTLQAFLGKMVEQNRGHIVGISSMAGLLGFNNLVPYCSSKFAVRGTHEGVFEELRLNSEGKSKIKFTMIFPYMVDTGLFKKATIRFERLMPVIKPADAAAAIISAQRRGIQEASIPRYLFHLQRVLRLFPNDANILVKQFLKANIESDI